MPHRGYIALRDRKSKNVAIWPFSPSAQIFRVGRIPPLTKSGGVGQKPADGLNFRKKQAARETQNIENEGRRREISGLPGIF